MSRLKTRVLSGTIVAAIVVFSLVCLAWATRTDGRRSQGRGDRC